MRDAAFKPRPEHETLGRSGGSKSIGISLLGPDPPLSSSNMEQTSTALARRGCICRLVPQDNVAAKCPK